jgi:hypothetical protein
VPVSTSAASSSGPAGSAPSNGREVCTNVRARNNTFFADYDGADTTRKPQLAEAFANDIRSQAAVATDAALRSQREQLADLVSSWASGTAPDLQAYVKALNSACEVRVE